MTLRTAASFALLLALLLSAFSGQGLAQGTQADPIRFELNAAIKLYHTERAEADEALIEAIQGRQKELLTSDWKLQRKVRLRKELESDLKAFQGSRRLPVCEWLKGAVETYKKSLSATHQTCADAFDKAATDYRKGPRKRRPLAKDVQAEKTKTLIPLPWEAKTSGAAGDDEAARKDLERRKAQLAPLLPVKGHVAVADFQDGVQAYSNRRYVWGKVPRNLGVTRFLRIEGGAEQPLTLQADRAGDVLLAISDEATAKQVGGLKALGWRKTPHVFSYGAERPIQMFVYRKRVAKGTLKLRRFGWAGPVVLLP